MTAPSRALAEAVLLPLTDGHVNLHPAVPLARALLAALDAPQPLDRETLAALKSCPFCGGKPLCGFRADMKWHVVCLDCGGSHEQHDDESKAIAAWNRRIARIRTLDEEASHE